MILNRRFQLSFTLITLVLATGLAQSADSPQAELPLTLISVGQNTASAASNGASTEARASAELEWLVFASGADNLVAADHNRRQDIFVKPAVGELEIISKSANGLANGDSFSPDISADGEWIVFASDATNLVNQDQNGKTDVFIYRRSTGALTRLQPPMGSSDGNSWAPRISASGQRIVFLSDASNWVDSDYNGMTDVFVYDQSTQIVQRASLRPNGIDITDHPPISAQISADGQCVSIESRSELYVTDDENGLVDYFVTQPSGLGTRRASIGSFGEELHQVTPGRHVLIDCSRLIFHSMDPRATPSQFVTGFFLNDNGTNSHLALDAWSSSEGVAITLSRNGRHLAVGTDSGVNLPSVLQQIDLQSGLIQSSSSRHGLPMAIANSGTRMVIQTNRPIDAHDHRLLGNIGIYDFESTQTQWQSSAAATTSTSSMALGASGYGLGIVASGAFPTKYRHQAVSAQGRFVLFSSLAPNLVSGDHNGVEDVFVRDLISQQTTRVSVRADGSEASDASAPSDLSSNGDLALFESCDHMGLSSAAEVCDLFARNLLSGALEQVNVSSQSAPADLGGPPGRGHQARLSADGRWVVFSSLATNLVSPKPPEGPSVYLRDRQLGATIRLGAGSDANISRNGRYVIWVEGLALRLWNRDLGALLPLSLSLDGLPLNGTTLANPSVSDSGQYVAYDSDAGNLVAADRNERADVFVFDRVQNRNVQVNRSGDHAVSTGDLSADGLSLAYLTGDYHRAASLDLVVAHWQAGTFRQIASSARRSAQQAQIARARFSPEADVVTFVGRALDNESASGLGDLPAVFTARLREDSLFRNGFD